MKSDHRTFVIRCCLLGLILGQIAVTQSQPRRNGRTRVTQARHQVVSSRRPGSSRVPSVRQSLTVVRGARGNRRAGSPQRQRAPKTSTRNQQLARLRQRSRALRQQARPNIPGAGLDSFLRDNRPYMMHRSNLRLPARQRGASVGSPRIFARNLQVLDGRRPQAMRLSDQGTANSRSPVRIRARLRTNSAPSPTTSTRTSSTSSKAATTAKSNPRTSPNINTSPGARQPAGAASNMISIDSLLSLINGIRGQQGGAAGAKSPSGSNAAKTTQRSRAAPARKTAVNPTASTVFRSTTPSRRPLSPGSSQTATAVDMQSMMTLFGEGAGTNQGDTPAFDPSLAMLAMMNPGEGIFSSFMSSPLLLREFASGSGIKSIVPTPSSGAEGNSELKAGKKKKKKRQGAGGKKKKQKPTMPQNPTLGAAGIMDLRNMAGSGNAAQKKMMQSLLFKSLPEELRENIQKRIAKAAKPTTPASAFEHKRIGK